MNINSLGIAAFLLAILITIWVGGWNSGYKAGQRDAFMGEYKYSFQTNVVIDAFRK